jgi:transposase
VSWAEDRIARLEAQAERLLEIVAQRDASIVQRDAEIAALKARVAELETQLGQNSTNSHKPPSTDPPGMRTGKRPTGRKRGGQPGHKANKRVLLPAEKVTRRTVMVPSRCKGCGCGRLIPTGSAPRIHQVVDVPEIQPDVHEIAMHSATCRDCGQTTWAGLPEGTPAHMFGPRLLALIGYFLAGRVSRRQLCELLTEVFGIPVSLGALSEAEARTSDAIAAPVEQAVVHVRGQPVKHVDASTWRLGGAYAALWTIATALVTVFFVTADARSETIRSLLGALGGILVSDRGTQFTFWAMVRRQICWAHLIRKFVAFSERADEGRKIGEGLLLLAHAVLSAWHRVRDGTMSRARFRVVAGNAEVAMVRLLEDGVRSRLRGLSGSCADILEHRDALFTFAYAEGVEPTNNHAERALRPFVIWRKVSYGSQSERGCLFAQRIMTVAQTLRQQRRSVFGFLVDACQAAIQGTPPPTLLPATR